MSERNSPTPDLADRLAKLSTAQREALERLMAKAPRPAPAPAAAARPVEQSSIEWDFAAGDRAGQTKRFYEVINRNLNATEYADCALFMNLGYVPAGAPGRSVVALPAHCLNRNSVMMALELVGDAPVDGRAVLDVGCGRGGTVSTINQYFTPRRTIGLDLCQTGVAFCSRRHGRPGTAFVNGDAERLPFADASFDVVTNVESSHTYPDIRLFFSEVARVLTPGGVFLWTDLLPAPRMTHALELLREVGFVLEVERDISPNVLAACDLEASVRTTHFGGRDNDDDTMANMTGRPGSEVYETMRSRRSVYGMFRSRKA